MQLEQNIDMDGIIQESEIDGYQVLVTGIKWNNKIAKQYHSSQEYAIEELPEQFALDLPENILNQANKKQNNFNDVIESFVYNFLTHKFNHEVNSCSIWLPLEK